MALPQRAVLATVLGAAVVSALAGCASDEPAPPPPATAAAPASAGASSSAGSPAAAASTVASAACPVTAATLEQAFRANPGLVEALVLGSGLRDVVCREDYATAKTSPDPTRADPATVLFAYEKATATWTAVTGGTELDCSPPAPARVAARLPGCTD